MTYEDIVKKIVEKVAKDQNYTDYKHDIKQITTEGANYTSFLYPIKISQNNHDDLYLFAKLAAFGEESRKEFPIEEVYNVEVYFYDTMGREFQSIEENHKVPEKHRLFLSKMYAYSKEPLEEIIVMDDLSEMGFQSYDRFKALDWKEMTAIVDEMAKFHALNFAFGYLNPDGFAKAKENMKSAKLMENPAVIEMWRSMISSSLDVLEEQNRGPYERFFTEKFDEIMAKFMTESKQNVFIHGDFRPSNLMHKINENGEIQVAILDYQTLRCSTVIYDLMYLIFTSTDRSFRKQHYKALLEYYLSQLEQALQRLGVQPDQVYSKEDYQQELKENTIMGLFAAAFVLPIVLVDKSEAPTVDGNMSPENFCIKRSSLFKERFNDIVEEFVNWGIIQ